MLCHKNVLEREILKREIAPVGAIGVGSKDSREIFQAFKLHPDMQNGICYYSLFHENTAAYRIVSLVLPAASPENASGLVELTVCDFCSSSMLL